MEERTDERVQYGVPNLAPAMIFVTDPQNLTARTGRMIDISHLTKNSVKPLATPKSQLEARYRKLGQEIFKTDDPWPISLFGPTRQFPSEKIGDETSPYGPVQPASTVYDKLATTAQINFQNGSGTHQQYYGVYQ